MLSRPIAIGLSPNTERDDLFLALKTLFSFWRWRGEEEVKKLEEEFARFFGADYYALAVNSGRSAQYLILKGLGIERGDQIALQAFTCGVVSQVIVWLGGEPLFVDITREYNLNPEDLERKITSRTKAVIVQHTFGIPAAIERIKKVTEKHRLFLIEDCAHSLGGNWRGKPLGCFGQVAFFSFGRDKILSSVFGGMILTRDKDLYRRIKKLRDKLSLPSCGWVAQQLFHPLALGIILPFYRLGGGKLLLWLFQRLGLLSRAVSPPEKEGKQPSLFPRKMPGGLAVLASHQLKKLERFLSHRQMIARFYFQRLENLGLGLPPKKKGAVWLRFPVTHPQAQELYLYAKKRGVLFGDWYRPVVMAVKSLTQVGYQSGSCPVAEELSLKVVNLPTYPTLTIKEAERVVELIKQWLATN